MSDTAQILRFPTKRVPRSALAPSCARVVAREYWNLKSEARTHDVRVDILSNPDVLLALCSTLKEQRDSNPSSVAEEASALYEWLISEVSVGVFDERDYFLGETALIAGGATRLLGRRGEAESWFDRAESAYRHTINAAPLLATVAYSRLTLSYDRHQYEKVLGSLPAIMESFARLQMYADVLKCHFLEAMCLKNTNHTVEAQESLERMCLDPKLRESSLLRGLVLVHLGELLAESGRWAEAVNVYAEAMEVSANQPIAVAHLKGAIGTAFRQEGRLEEAIEAFRASVRDYAEAGMRHSVAYIRVVLAETLIAADRHREAEWEILAALPTIEEEKMVPEGLAAVALLKESVSRRKTDPNALRELREHLKART